MMRKFHRGAWARLGPATAILALLAVGPSACGDDDNTTHTGGSSTTTSTQAGGQGGAGGQAAGGASSTGGATSNGGSGGGIVVTPEVYNFESRFTPGVSAVSHSGQSLRQVLIAALDNYVSGLTVAIDSDAFSPPDVATVVAALDYYFEFDDTTSGGDAHGLVTTPAVDQGTYDDLGSGKDLKSKFAGNDTSTDHLAWGTPGNFQGWSDQSIATSGGATTTPEGLLDAFIARLGQLAVDRENGIVLFEPGTGTPIAEVYVSARGLDLKQLIHKFVQMGVAYSQGLDDYLDDSTAGKGLLSSNAQDGAEPYSVLGHAWDEGFGYFGAARDYPRYTDDELAQDGGRVDWQGLHDSDASGGIDLTREVNWGASINAAKRDHGATDAIDFTKDAFDAFWAGRQVILGAGDTLTAAEQSELSGYAEAAVDAWDKAIVATIIHYINDTIADMDLIGQAGYVYLDHAKHWSEMKGFALGLQFNPRSKLDPASFAGLHAELADRPMVVTDASAARSAYRAQLIAARLRLATAYGFSASNAANW